MRPDGLSTTMVWSPSLIRPPPNCMVWYPFLRFTKKQSFLMIFDDFPWVLASFENWR